MTSTTAPIAPAATAQFRHVPKYARGFIRDELNHAVSGQHFHLISFPGGWQDELFVGFQKEHAGRPSSGLDRNTAIALRTRRRDAFTRPAMRNLDYVLGEHALVQLFSAFDRRVAEAQLDWMLTVARHEDGVSDDRLTLRLLPRDNKLVYIPSDFCQVQFDSWWRRDYVYVEDATGGRRVRGRRGRQRAQDHWTAVRDASLDPKQTIDRLLQWRNNPDLLLNG
ncbi:Scr1 family TA system antitoxin-like transcriptional regulator [Kutzneria buriramensis]|uniref:DUF5753 domain-containing protein n=1 Tax=Kutzneria buriramensis TaxID=1045776 RepID=A0A3E0GXV5_9PSEU|nr:Scr1 family TA system antitoxin-like transcriptional regulator [Kutzneria buriramensis]REH31103.1 hypothetical protein BCF44_122126 [Kutzneria buriramensis]